MTFVYLVLSLHLLQRLTVFPHVVSELGDLLLHRLSFPLPLYPFFVAPPSLFLRLPFCRFQSLLYLLLFLETFFQLTLCIIYF